MFLTYGIHLTFISVKYGFGSSSGHVCSFDGLFDGLNSGGQSETQ